MLFRAAPEAYGGMQARGPFGATAASLHHNHSNAGSEPHLPPTPQLMATQIFNPLSKARNQTHDLMVPSRIRFHCTTTGTPELFTLKGVLTAEKSVFYKLEEFPLWRSG